MLLVVFVEKVLINFCLEKLIFTVATRRFLKLLSLFVDLKGILSNFYELYETVSMAKGTLSKFKLIKNYLGSLT